MLTSPLRDAADLTKAGREDFQIPPTHDGDELGDLIIAHAELSR
ncbi:MAG: hypothetical protein OSB46_15110 [Alphaproteobacteria bacterium]|nr:hypothetical protein [Alphaproteobacteria bacterium]